MARDITLGSVLIDLLEEGTRFFGERRPLPQVNRGRRVRSRVVSSLSFFVLLFFREPYHLILFFLI